MRGVFFTVTAPIRIFRLEQSQSLDNFGQQQSFHLTIPVASARQESSKPFFPNVIISLIRLPIGEHEDNQHNPKPICSLSPYQYP